MADTIIKKEHTLCICCMEEHDVLTVEVDEYNLFKGIDVNYKATYYYCSNEDVYFENGDMMNANDIAMKNEYKKITK